MKLKRKRTVRTIAEINARTTPKAVDPFDDAVVAKKRISTRLKDPHPLPPTGPTDPVDPNGISDTTWGDIFGRDTWHWSVNEDGYRVAVWNRPMETAELIEDAQNGLPTPEPRPLSPSPQRPSTRTVDGVQRREVIELAVGYGLLNRSQAQRLSLARLSSLVRTYESRQPHPWDD